MENTKNPVSTLHTAQSQALYNRSVASIWIILLLFSRYLVLQHHQVALEVWGDIYPASGQISTIYCSITALQLTTVLSSDHTCSLQHNCVLYSNTTADIESCSVHDMTRDTWHDILGCHERSIAIFHCVRTRVPRASCRGRGGVSWQELTNSDGSERNSGENIS